MGCTAPQSSGVLPKIQRSGHGDSYRKGSVSGIAYYYSISDDDLSMIFGAFLPEIPHPGRISALFSSILYNVKAEIASLNRALGEGSADPKRNFVRSIPNCNE
jgi:hypothetical protein